MDKINLKFIFYFCAIFLGLIQVWNTRFYMNPDGVSYLDIGDAYFRGDFSTGVNAYWSPLYSWILGLFLYVIKPNAYYEFPLVHLVNFLIYILSFISFNFFLRELVESVKREKQDSFIFLPEWSFVSISYLLYLYATLKFITLWIVTPDLLLSVFIYLIGGLILKIKKGLDDIKNYALLGILLGFSYLCKAVMFPLGVIFLISNLSKKNVIKTLLAFFCFILIALPFIVSISEQKKRLTFGDTGTLNYVWQVNDVTSFYMVHWQGYERDNGIPAHATRQVNLSPDVFEFAEPINVTYSPWFDPSYWYEGVKPDLNPKHLFRFLKDNIKEYLLIFIVFQGVLIICFLYLYFKMFDRNLFKKNLNEKSGLLTPSLSAILIYSLVYPELRYIAPFLVVVWLILFSSLNFKDSSESHAGFKFATNLMVIFIFVIILCGKFTPSDYSYIRELFSKNKNENINYDVAKELEKVGIISGDKVATFGYGHLAFWARLGKLQIVAEMPDKEIKKFWRLSNSNKEKVLDVFKQTGAKAIVLDTKPKYGFANWQRLGDTEFYVYFLN